MTFKQNDQRHGHIHLIVHDNATIYYTWLHPAMPKKIVRDWVSQFYYKKYFKFYKCQKWVFMKQLQIRWYKFPTFYFSHKIDHIRYVDVQISWISSFVATFAHLNEFCSISRDQFNILVNFLIEIFEERENNNSWN